MFDSINQQFYKQTSLGHIHFKHFNLMVSRLSKFLPKKILTLVCSSHKSIIWLNIWNIMEYHFFSFSCRYTNNVPYVNNVYRGNILVQQVTGIYTGFAGQSINAFNTYLHIIWVRMHLHL